MAKLITAIIRYVRIEYFIALKPRYFNNKAIELLNYTSQYFYLSINFESTSNNNNTSAHLISVNI
ncbi:MAG: hypothetical protein J0I84_25920, partial [Terrimonas sp.]|nr:hypothetical protein [Terrimonas sp.]